MQAASASIAQSRAGSARAWWNIGLSMIGQTTWVCAKYSARRCLREEVDGQSAHVLGKHAKEPGAKCSGRTRCRRSRARPTVASRRSGRPSAAASRGARSPARRCERCLGRTTRARRPLLRTGAHACTGARSPWAGLASSPSTRRCTRCCGRAGDAATSERQVSRRALEFGDGGARKAHPFSSQGPHGGPAPLHRERLPWRGWRKRWIEAARRESAQRARAAAAAPPEGGPLGSGQDRGRTRHDRHERDARTRPLPTTGARSGRPSLRAGRAGAAAVAAAVLAEMDELASAADDDGELAGAAADASTLPSTI